MADAYLSMPWRMFRNEGAGVASELIRSAVAATLAYCGEPPTKTMITFLDRRKVRAIKVRGKETFGRTWELAGFQHVGETVGGLMAFRLPAYRFPEPQAPLGLKSQHRDFRTKLDVLAEMFF